MHPFPFSWVVLTTEMWILMFLEQFTVYSYRLTVKEVGNWKPATVNREPATSLKYIYVDFPLKNPRKCISS